MMIAAGILEWSLDIGKMVIAAVLTYSGTRAIEGYKVKEARKDAEEARRRATEQAVEDKKRLEEQRATSDAARNRLYDIMARSTSEIVALRESQANLGERDDAIDEDLGLAASDAEVEEEAAPESEVVMPITSKSGPRILWLEDRTLVATPRYVHFSWKGVGFKIRDFIG